MCARIGGIMAPQIVALVSAHHQFCIVYIYSLIHQHVGSRATCVFFVDLLSTE